MVTIERDTGSTRITVSSCEPLIYLDHWALRRLAAGPTEQRRFLAALDVRGTLAFSLMNVAEIGADRNEVRAEEIKSFLAAVGPRWAPITIDAMKVIEAEETDATDQRPCLSERFLRDPFFAARLVAGPVNLSHVVDLTRGEEGDDLRHATSRHAGDLVATLTEWRQLARNDRRGFDGVLPEVPFEPARPMRTLYNGLVRRTVLDGFPITENHVRDLFHAVAALRCAHMVTLDSHWVEQVRKLALPAEFVRVYSPSTFANLLEDLERNAGIPDVPS